MHHRTHTINLKFTGLRSIHIEFKCTSNIGVVSCISLFSLLDQVIYDKTYWSSPQKKKKNLLVQWSKINNLCMMQLFYLYTIELATFLKLLLSTLIVKSFSISFLSLTFLISLLASSAYDTAQFESERPSLFFDIFHLISLGLNQNQGVPAHG